MRLCWKIFVGVGEQNAIDFSSAGGLRNMYVSQERAVLGGLQCKYEILVCVCLCEVERERERVLAGSLAVTFGCFLSDISTVKQTRSNLSRVTEQLDSLDFFLTFQFHYFVPRHLSLCDSEFFFLLPQISYFLFDSNFPLICAHYHRALDFSMQSKVAE